MYKIKINNFKKIQKADISLGKINVLIGANNSGKSSFIQAIQFAIGCAQSLDLRSANWVGGLKRTLALDSTEFLYSPTREVAHLRHKEPLTSAKKGAEKKFINFELSDSAKNTATIEVSKGKNGGFTTTLSVSSRKFGQTISEMVSPFCVYVPGISGIPISEKYEVPFTIRKSATRGDSNNYLRNILLSLHSQFAKWQFFTSNINAIYPNVKIIVEFNESTSELISVFIQQSSQRLPLDLVGTGLLQIIQIFAYIEYFNPRIILLDEPDAHLHPTKQNALATLLKSITEGVRGGEILEEYTQKLLELRGQENSHKNNENDIALTSEDEENLRLMKSHAENTPPHFIISTHSRYILTALDGYADVFHFNQGIATANIEHSQILQDIGAIDAEYLFNNKMIRYVFCTEDRVDNIAEKKLYLKKIALASGFKELEIEFHSYESCTKVDFARILKDFIAKQIPQVQIILHYDKDQRSSDDPALNKLREDCAKKGIALFVTKYSELENYFCQKEHIREIYGFDDEEAGAIYSEAMRSIAEKTTSKTKDYIINCRPDICMENNIIKSNKIDSHTKFLTESGEDILAPGKELLGSIKSILQAKYRKNPEAILNPSSALKDDTLVEIAQNGKPD